MSENWAIALTIFSLGQFALIASAVICAFFTLHNRMSSNEVGAEHRFTLLEAKCEKWFMLTGTSALHSPTDHLGTDKEIERFIMLYRSGEHDMPDHEWIHYKNFFKELSHNLSATPNERALADGFFELCEHKTQRFQRANIVLK